MVLRDIMEKIRLSLVKLPAIGYGQIPEVPVSILRDLWIGNSVYGMHLIRGELIYQDCIIPLYPGQWGGRNLSWEIQVKLHGFSWLRDLREVGTENARLVARNLVADWISSPPSYYNSIVYQPLTLANRMANWLSHYDFFAESAEKYFHQQFMQRILQEGRYVVAMLPAIKPRHEAFTLLKAAMALSLCMPEQFDLISKITKLLQNELSAQILDDGIHISRNPELQLYILRDLVEIRLMYQLVNSRFPSDLNLALDIISRALRALRHGDGKLALFNGSGESDANYIDRVLSNSTQKRVAMTDMKSGGYIRCFSNRSTLLIDSGIPLKNAPIKYLGSLSFEFSIGKQRIIVNCGSGGSSAWRSALAGTAAFSVLKLCNSDCVLLQDNQILDSNFRIESNHEMKDSAHWVELSHNGWKQVYNAIYNRKFYLNSDGYDLRGEELIETDQILPFEIRFHLHPTIKVEEKIVDIEKDKKEKIFILSFNHPQEGNQIWWFRFSGADGRIEDSVYFGQKVRLATKQIVLYNQALSVKADKKSGKPLNIIQDQQSIAIKQSEEESDYVAIFHNQNDNAEIRKKDTSDHDHPRVSESLSETNQEISKQSEVNKVSESFDRYQEQKKIRDHDQDHSMNRKDQSIIIQWALRRKL